MKFLVETASKGSARLGSLSKSEHSALKTPAFLHYTKGASVPFLTREVFGYIPHDPTEPLSYSISLDTTYHMLKAVQASGDGLAAFASLGNGAQECVTSMTLKNPAEVCLSGHHEQDVMPVWTRFGKRLISAEQYMDFVDAFVPDMFHVLCDGDTNAESSKKRVLKSADRTEKFFEQCLERYKQSERLQNSMLIAPIEGGYAMKTREVTIKNLLHPEIGGYLLDGFHNNGKTAALLAVNDIQPLVSGCLDLLPADKLRLMFGAYSPVTTLELISLGVDLFDNSYAYLASANNCALTFNSDVGVHPDGGVAYDMDLADEKYKTDFTPICATCSCLACTKHTRAYVHHLVNTKELLASILLMIHNTHHYVEFFKSIRRAIADDSLPKLVALVSSQKLQGSRLDECLSRNDEAKPKEKNGKGPVVIES